MSRVDERRLASPPPFAPASFADAKRHHAKYRAEVSSFRGWSVLAGLVGRWQLIGGVVADMGLTVAGDREQSALDYARVSAGKQNKT